MSYVYIKSEPGLYTVGFYDPEDKWHADSDHRSREDAAQRVRFLNGGRDRITHALFDENLRDLFAAAALAGMLAGNNPVTNCIDKGVPAIEAYDFADAMMERRKGK